MRFYEYEVCRSTPVGATTSAGRMTRDFPESAKKCWLRYLDLSTVLPWQEGVSCGKAWTDPAAVLLVKAHATPCHQHASTHDLQAHSFVKLCEIVTGVLANQLVQAQWLGMTHHSCFAMTSYRPIGHIALVQVSTSSHGTQQPLRSITGSNRFADSRSCCTTGLEQISRLMCYECAVAFGA